MQITTQLRACGLTLGLRLSSFNAQSPVYGTPHQDRELGVDWQGAKRLRANQPGRRGTGKAVFQPPFFRAKAGTGRSIHPSGQRHCLGCHRSAVRPQPDSCTGAKGGNRVSYRLLPPSPHVSSCKKCYQKNTFSRACITDRQGSPDFHRPGNRGFREGNWPLRACCSSADCRRPGSNRRGNAPMRRKTRS